MPVVRKLDPDEVQTIEYKGKGLRKIIEEQYDQFLADFAVGEYGEVELEPDDNRLTVRNRLKAAATRRGVSLDLKRTSGELIRFKMLEGNGPRAVAPEVAAPEPEPEPAPVVSETPPKRKGGRPKKISA
jgi:hypothetical protein